MSRLIDFEDLRRGDQWRYNHPEASSVYTVRGAGAMPDMLKCDQTTGDGTTYRGDSFYCPNPVVLIGRAS